MQLQLVQGIIRDIAGVGERCPVVEFRHAQQVLQAVGKLFVGSWVVHTQATQAELQLGEALECLLTCGARLARDILERLECVCRQVSWAIFLKKRGTHDAERREFACR